VATGHEGRVPTLLGACSQPCGQFVGRQAQPRPHAPSPPRHVGSLAVRPARAPQVVAALCARPGRAQRDTARCPQPHQPVRHKCAYLPGPPTLQSAERRGQSQPSMDKLFSKLQFTGTSWDHAESAPPSADASAPPSARPARDGADHVHVHLPADTTAVRLVWTDCSGVHRCRCAAKPLHAPRSTAHSPHHTQYTHIQAAMEWRAGAAVHVVFSQGGSRISLCRGAAFRHRHHRCLPGHACMWRRTCARLRSFSGRPRERKPALAPKLPLVVQ
jgi:hypothetical protein